MLVAYRLTITSIDMVSQVTFAGSPTWTAQELSHT